MDERPIVFLHVPKTAGATLRNLLVAVYGHRRVFWFEPGKRQQCVERLRGMDPKDRAKFKVFTGHIPYGLVDELLGQPLDYITVLRDPVERLRSLYQFVRDDPAHRLHPAAQGGLAEFAAGDTRELDNLQVRMVGGPPVRRGVTIDVYDRAVGNLSTFAAVGVQEHFDPFVRHLADRFGCRRIPAVEASHVARNRIDVDDEARDVILTRNRWDAELHRRVGMGLF